VHGELELVTAVHGELEPVQALSAHSASLHSFLLLATRVGSLFPLQVLTPTAGTSSHYIPVCMCVYSLGGLGGRKEALKELTRGKFL